MNIVAMLHNQAQNTYHPIVFAMAPLPGDAQVEGAMRYRSRGHHTTGFSSREDAVAFATTEWIPVLGADKALDGDIIWDGVDIPALTLFFGQQDSQLRPLL